MQVDVLDTEYIWCKGFVVKLKPKKNGNKMLLVHYKGWSKVYDELIESNSMRLAPDGFFTNRAGITSIKRHPKVRVERGTAKRKCELRDCGGESDQPAGPSADADAAEETPLKRRKREVLFQQVLSTVYAT